MPSLASELLPQGVRPTPACCIPAASTSEESGRDLSPRSLYQLDATWTADTGDAFPLTSLRGGPVVIAMFFAQCEYACPMLVSDLRRLRDSLPPGARAGVRLVLVSFDVARDTPAALKAYRERASLDAHWTLLHGDTDAVSQLAMVLGVKYKQDSRGQFSHSNQFAILNAEGEIVHRQAGLLGDVSEAARILAGAGK